jgi:predicted AlkP superfamily phosphohydrolase/phosphomutase
VATGKHPEEHGILANAIDDKPPTSNMRRVPALWNIASVHGRSVGIVGYYVSWPPEPVDGFVISDRGWAESEPALPAGILEEIGAGDFWVWRPDSAQNREEMKRFIDFEFDPAFSKRPRFTFEWYRQFLVAKRLHWIYPRDASYAQIGLRLLQREHPDFFAIYFRGIDFVSHAFWMYHQPDAEEYHPRAKGYLTPAMLGSLGGIIGEYYAYQDELLGLFLSAAGDDVVVFVVSDHGFGPPPPANWPEPGSPDEEIPPYWYLTGMHRPNGIFAAWGKNVVRGGQVEAVTLFDLAPTILYTLGLPVGRDMSGHVLTGIFQQPGAVQYVATHGSAGEPKSDQQQIESADDEEILERLRALGYIE